MNTGFLIEELQKNARIFESFFIPTPEADDFIRWKPFPEKWCLLEILCHLIDEEKEDFRTRVKFALENTPGQPPAIDPTGWVLSRNYIHQNYAEKCVEFLSERNLSTIWLNSLPEGNWTSFFIHPKFGKFTAHYLLSNWLAHDFLHIRQIIKLKYDYLAQKCGENSKYAGEWA